MSVRQWRCPEHRFVVVVVVVVVATVVVIVIVPTVNEISDLGTMCIGDVLERNTTVTDIDIGSME